MKRCNHIVAIERINPQGEHYVYLNTCKKISENAEIFNFCPKCGGLINKKKNWLGKYISRN